MPRLPVDGVTGSFATLDQGDHDLERTLNVRGDATPVSGHPAASHSPESIELPPERRIPVARPLEPTMEQPALREPDGGGVSTTPTRRSALDAPARASTPVSERNTGGDSDRARYDDGRHRYDWDIRTDDRGDHRGRVGLGATRGPNDVDVDVGFDEASGEVDARLRAGRRLAAGTSVHGELGVDSEGLTHARAGGSHAFAGGHSVRGEVGIEADGRAHVDANWSRNRDANREDVRARLDENGVSAEYRGHHEGEGWRTDERVSVGPDGAFRASVSGEARREVRPGTTIDARGTLSSDGTVHGEAGLEHRISERVTVSERVRVDEDGVRSHIHGARGAFADGRADASAYIEHDNEGRRSIRAESTVRTDGATHSGSARYSGEEGEPGRLEGRYTYHGRADRGSTGTRVETEGRIDEDGRWRVGGHVRHRLNDEVSFREGFTVDSAGRRTHEHGLELNAGGLGRGSATVRHGSEGHIEADARYGLERDGRRGEVRVGYDERGVRVEGDVGAESERNRIAATAGWNDREGVHAEGSLTHRLDEDSEVTARLSGNSTGALSGNVRAETRLGETRATRASVSLGGDLRDGSVRGEARIDHRATAGRPGGHVSVGMSRNDTDVEGRVGGGVSVTDLFGIGANARVGGDARVTLSRRRPASGSAEWVDTLRSDVLRDQPEARYVSFGARGRATMNVGTRVPLGAGYVDAGYERGETYDVEVTRLTEDARLGERPSMSELNVDNSAQGVLAMRAGESFRISGSTTHTTRGGGGVGTSVSAGPMVDASLSGGVHVSYAVSGKTVLDVTRGGEGTARVVVSHEDSGDSRGGLDIRAGINPNYGELARATGLDEMPDVGPVGTVATSAARGAARRWLSFHAKPEHSIREGDRRLLDVRLDLADESAGVAYDEAVSGDWTRLEALARDGHRAVDIERSIFTELNTHATPVTVTGLGLGYHSDSREELRESEVSDDSGRFEVVSEVENDARRVDGWFSGNHISVTDHAREVRSLDGSDLGDIKASEHWLSWSLSSSDVNTSREELITQLGAVERMVGPDRATSLVAYRARIAEVEEHRRFWIGPRNELRETQVSLHVDIDRGGLNELKDLDAQELWSLYDRVWRENHPTEEHAPWDPIDDQFFIDSTTEMYAEMAAEEQKNSRMRVLEKLATASRGGDESRIDTLREILASQGADTEIMAVIVTLVGPENAKVSLSVDSTAGQDGKAYDFNFTSTGTEFDVQKRVFGEDL
ncbi:MAG: hypothetical protein VX834_04155 [Myxococcota bacterium]|nr:hypothetical protein [Myxococcota bacterium]